MCLLRIIFREKVNGKLAPLFFLIRLVGHVVLFPLGIFNSNLVMLNYIASCNLPLAIYLVVVVLSTSFKFIIFLLYIYLLRGWFDFRFQSRVSSIIFKLKILIIIFVYFTFTYFLAFFLLLLFLIGVDVVNEPMTWIFRATPNAPKLHTIQKM